MVLCHKATSHDIDYDVGFTNIDKHVVFEDYRVLLADEDPIPNTEVLDQVVVRVDIKLDLEVPTPVLLSRLLVLVRDHEVIYDAFLIQIEF